MKVKTKSGFTCNVNENKLKDWRYIKALAKCDSKEESEVLEGLTFLVSFLLGTDGEEKLMQHIATEDGIVGTDVLIEELKEIIRLINKELKKSQSSQE